MKKLLLSVTLLVSLSLGIPIAWAQDTAYQEVTELENVLQSSLGNNLVDPESYSEPNQFAAKVVRLFPLIQSYNSDQAEVLRLNLSAYLGQQKLSIDNVNQSAALRSGAYMPPMTAKSYVIFDPVSKQVLLQQNQDSVRAIASISKLITAMVAWDSFSADQEFVMTAAAKTYGSSSEMPVGTKFNLSEALTYLLIRSSNDVANQIKITHDQLYGYLGESFVQKMNRKVDSIGMYQTSFSGPSGLENDNVSTAYELALMIDHIRTQYPQLLSLGRQSVLMRHGKTLVSSNPIRFELGWLGGKNGYITKSGRTMALLFEKNDSHVIIVSLGSVENDGGADARSLLSIVE